MDWSNERFVRLYTRDTPEWLCWCWQARALWPLLLRKADRSGVIANKLGARGLAALAGLPVDVVEAGLPDLLADGCLAEHQLGLVIPNYIEANEAPLSDKQRQRESRERRRVVTKRDSGSQNVTERHEVSRDVTPRHSDPIRAVPILSDQIPDLSHHAHAIPPVPAQQAAHVPAVPPEVDRRMASRPAQHVEIAFESPDSQPATVDRDPKPANVIQPAGYNPDDPRARGGLAEATYRRVSDARVEVARKLGLPEPMPFPVLTPGRHPLSMTDLQDRIREEGQLAPVVCDRIVANLTAQAVETRSLEWLAEKFSTAGSWRTAKDWTPGASQRPRAGPFGSAGRAPEEQPRKIPTLSRPRSTP